MSDSFTTLELHEEPAQVVRLLVAYNGASFAGFARNEGVRSVAGDLEAHLAKVLREPVTITGAGRTDRGVHAWGQVVSFRTRSPRLDVDRLMRSINGVLGPDIVVREAAIAADDFDARFSATWRRYRYSILRSVAPSPFLAATTWHLSDELDLDAMRTASDAFVGQHDFSSFCRKPPAAADGSPRSLQRTVLSLEWSEPLPELLQLEITAMAFCHQMVRAITGTIVDVGLGRIAAESIVDIFAARDRSAAGRLAPPQGLCLHEVGY